MLLLMLISQTPTQASDTKRRPVVLVPGLYGSSLYALEHDGSDLPPPPEAILEGRRIWPPRNGTLAREDIAMLACSCDSIASITQPWSTDDANWGVCHSSVPGFVVLPPSRRSGLYALCDFDDDPNEQSHYMTTLVRHLEVSIGVRARDREQHMYMTHASITDHSSDTRARSHARLSAMSKERRSLDSHTIGAKGTTNRNLISRIPLTTHRIICHRVRATKRRALSQTAARFHPQDHRRSVEAGRYH